MEPLPPSHQFRLPDEQVPAEYRNLGPLTNAQPQGTGCLMFEMILSAFMLGGTLGSCVALLFARDVADFIVAIVLGGILAVAVLWVPTLKAVEHAANDPAEFGRLRKSLDSIDDFG